MYDIEEMGPNMQMDRLAGGPAQGPGRAPVTLGPFFRA